MRAAMVACRVAGTLDVGDVTAAEVGTAIAVEHAAFGEITHDLLGEERVPGGLVGDPGGAARAPTGPYPAARRSTLRSRAEFSGASEIV